MIEIRNARIADAALIAEISTLSFVESHGHSAPVDDIKAYTARTFEQKNVEKELADKTNTFHIIYYKGQPAGYSKIILNCSHDLIEEKVVTKLERIYLLKEFHALGLGSALLNFILVISKDEDQKGIWLFVWIENHRALKFYKKSGFKVKGNVDFRISPTHTNPNHVMYLEF
jgi:ribosomal protein S18 acetylase RimI-like enzyme